MSATIGGQIEEQVAQALRDLAAVPLPGGRDLPILTGLDPRGATYFEPQENVLIKAIDILVASGRVFRYGNSIVVDSEHISDSDRYLNVLRAGSSIVTGAEDFLANLFVCGAGTTQFSVPKSFSDVLLRSSHVQRLPRILQYATRPVFDSNFILRGPGWHPECEILVHGPNIEPICWDAGDPSLAAIERLPHHLRTLLSGFCFKSNADVANTIGFMLTGLLVHHFIGTGKPLALVDGNQSGLGKTLLMRTIGAVLDSREPELTTYTANDEELKKTICGTLRGSPQSILIFDNAKMSSGSVVSSPTIECNCVAPMVSIRILGQSVIYSRPNDVLWSLTMNDMRAAPDAVNRALPIRLEYEGVPRTRDFTGQPDPIAYAQQYRLEILGELAGMPILWNQLGRPRGRRQHRLGLWVSIIGGILEVAGLPEFLENADEAAAEFNVQLDELAALAEMIVTLNGPFTITGSHGVSGQCGRALGPSGFVQFFRNAKILTDKLDRAVSERSRQVTIGKFLTRNVGSEVEIAIGERTGRAVLRVDARRAGAKLYWFDVTWDTRAAAQTPPAAVPSAGGLPTAAPPVPSSPAVVPSGAVSAAAAPLETPPGTVPADNMSLAPASFSPAPPPATAAPAAPPQTVAPPPTASTVATTQNRPLPPLPAACSSIVNGSSESEPAVGGSENAEDW